MSCQLSVHDNVFRRKLLCKCALQTASSKFHSAQGKFICSISSPFPGQESKEFSWNTPNLEISIPEIEQVVITSDTSWKNSILVKVKWSTFAGTLNQIVDSCSLKAFSRDCLRKKWEFAFNYYTTTIILLLLCFGWHSLHYRGMAWATLGVSFCSAVVVFIVGWQAEERNLSG